MVLSDDLRADILAHCTEEDGHLIFTPDPGHVHIHIDFKDGIKRPNHSVRRAMWAFYHPNEYVATNEIVTQTCQHVGDVTNGAGSCIAEACLVKKVLGVVGAAKSAAKARKVAQQEAWVAADNLAREWKKMSFTEYAERKAAGTLPRVNL